MKLNVQITPDKIQKFILAHCTYEGEVVTFLWGNPEAEWHKNIVDKIFATNVSNVEVVGGGKLKLLSESKMLYVWGKSSRYGEVPSELIKTTMKNCFPNYLLFFEEPPV